MLKIDVPELLVSEQNKKTTSFGDCTNGGGEKLRERETEESWKGLEESTKTRNLSTRKRSPNWIKPLNKEEKEKAEQTGPRRDRALERESELQGRPLE